MIAVITPALNTPKSNHSMQLPIAEAITALRTAASSTSASPPAGSAGAAPDSELIGTSRLWTLPEDRQS
ncbi:hypothetical protein GCM10010182_15040 [Actinomadura cremea]|nr:hypothetical protein GCM10010182_15040 [Actinomadura cremea]